MSLRLKIKLGVLGVLIFTALFLTYVSLTLEKGELTVAFLDVGQGDAIFIDSPSGNQILIDGGLGRGVLRELGKVMPFYDKKIDVVIASHPDADHTGGLNDVISRYKVELFMEPGVDSDTSIYNELKKRVEEKNIKIIEARRGMVIDLGKGAFLEILYPVLDTENMESNTASIVARLIYGESEFLLTGDSPSNIEEYLVSLGLNMDSDVLKAGHHGSKTSTSKVFVGAVGPEYAIISAGKDNRYGHPHKEVLDVLEKNNVKVLNTADVGRIIFKTDGVNLKLD